MINKLKKYTARINAHFKSYAESGETAAISPDLYRGATEGVVLTSDALVGRQGLNIYSEMRIDDQVKPALMLKKYSILASGWEIQSVSDTPEDELKAEFIRFAFEQMEGSIEQALLSISSALDFGFSLSEINWQLSDIEPFIDKIIIKNIKTKHPRDFEFEVDKFNNILPDGIHQQSTGKKLKIDKFLHYAYDSDFGSVYGLSDLRAAHRAWFSKSVILKGWKIYIERFAMPTPVALYTTKARMAQQDILNTILKNLSFRSHIIMPKDMIDELKFLEASGQGSEIFNKSIAYFDRAIVRSLLVPDQMGLGGEEATGSMAKAKQHFNIFLLSILKIQKDLSETVIKEQLIKRLIDFNFSDTKIYPKFVFMPLIEEDKQALATIWIDAVMKGVVSQDLADKNLFRKLVGFPEKDRDDEIPEQDEPLPDTEEPDEDEQPEENEIAQPDKDNAKKTEVRVVVTDLRQSSYVSKFAMSRELNRFEKKENFQEMGKNIVKIESALFNSLQTTIEKQRDDLIKVTANKQRGGEFTLPFITGLTLRFNAEIRKSMNEHFEKAYEFGTSTGKKLFIAPKLEPLSPAKALAFLKSKAFFATGLIDEDVKKNAKGILFRALNQGWSVKETQAALTEMFNPYLGDPTKIRSGKDITPHRLETIVRTNTNEAFNQGRKDSFKESVDDGFVIGYLYSAVLDDRTTAICNFLDGKILDPKDSSTDRLIPPNNFNCRSVIVPVTRDEGPVEFITAGEIGRANDLKATSKFSCGCC